MELSKNLYNLRKEYKISQQELAKALGVCQGTISQWELGLKEPIASNIVKICKYFTITNPSPP